MITRCALCPNKHHCLPPDGRGDVLFVGEAPGKQENAKGRVFIGKTGDEVNRHYLPLAGLRRDTVVFANTIACLPDTAGGKLDPKRRQDVALAECCTAHHLYPLIAGMGPKLIVTLGAFAFRALGCTGDLEHEHGIPQETAWGMVFPMYHPALGIYEPKKMLLIRNDWNRLRQFLAGKLPIRQDSWAGVEDYQEVTNAYEIETLDRTTPMACDTESDSKRQPFCLTYSQTPGCGRLIRSGRRDLLDAFQHIIRKWEGPILFHNWFYDWAVVEAMSLQFPFHRIVDTMAEVYRLGNLPQGLKALAYRELGMVMQDFVDLVSPYSRENVLNYYRIAAACEWPKPDPELVIDDKTGLWKLYKPHGMNTKLKRFFTDYTNNPDKDVFAMWEENWVEQHAMIEGEIGAYPGMCITHVPFEETLHYACRDADALIRLWPVLRQMRSRVRKFPQQEWRVA